MINNFSDFCVKLRECGFSMGGGNAKGIFAIIPYDWKEQEFMDTKIKWHTGDVETDPWEWRMRVLEERDDIAYAKVFFKTSGYITREWYPYFLKARRKGTEFEELYQSGKVGNMEKRIYDIIQESGEIALHNIKSAAGISKEENSKFDRAMTELQMKMFITMCGRAPKLNKNGEPYGWNSTVFCTVEKFWGEEFVNQADKISEKEAVEKITEQIYRLNPDAEKKKIRKFIYG